MTKDIQGAAEGNVVVTWDQDRTRILAVTRQDDDGHILSVIAEVPAPNVQPKGTAEGEVERLRAALAAQPKAPAWQPIETAPRDGSMFLCWVAAERWSHEDGGGSGRSHDVSQVDFCWWCDGVDGNGYFDPACGQIGDAQDVTHWMPLPAAPQTKEQP